MIDTVPIYLIFPKLFQVSGDRARGVIGEHVYSGQTGTNRQLHNTIYRIVFGLCRVIEKSTGKLIIKNLGVFVFLKRDRIL